MPSHAISAEVGRLHIYNNLRDINILKGFFFLYQEKKLLWNPLDLVNIFVLPQVQRAIFLSILSNYLCDVNDEFFRAIFVSTFNCIT